MSEAKLIKTIEEIWSPKTMSIVGTMENNPPGTGILEHYDLNHKITETTTTYGFSSAEELLNTAQHDIAKKIFDSNIHFHPVYAVTTTPSGQITYYLLNLVLNNLEPDKQKKLIEQFNINETFVPYSQQIGLHYNSKGEYLGAWYVGLFDPLVHLKYNSNSTFIKTVIEHYKLKINNINTTICAIKNYASEALFIMYPERSPIIE